VTIRSEGTPQLSCIGQTWLKRRLKESACVSMQAALGGCTHLVCWYPTEMFGCSCRFSCSGPACIRDRHNYGHLLCSSASFLPLASLLFKATMALLQCWPRQSRTIRMTVVVSGTGCWQCRCTWFLSNTLHPNTAFGAVCTVCCPMHHAF